MARNSSRKGVACSMNTPSVTVGIFSVHDDAINKKTQVHFKATLDDLSYRFSSYKE